MCDEHTRCMDLYRTGTLEIYKMQFRDPLDDEGTLDEEGQNLNMAFCSLLMFKYMILGHRR